MSELIKCEQCGKEFSKMGIKGHIWRKHTEEGKNLKAGNKKGFKIWNKGLTKQTSEKLKKSSEKLKSTILKNGFNWTGLKHSEETKKKISESRKKWFENNQISKKIGNGKFGWYEGYWCDSSYELAYVIYNLEQGIKFERNTKSFKYQFNEKILNYFPDFILEDGTFIEIKGRESFDRVDEKTKCKILQFQKPLKVLYNPDMKIYLDYAIEKYGKDFVSLYRDYVKPEKIESKYFKNLELKIEERKRLILESKVDFSKHGWVTKISKELNITIKVFNNFINKYFQEFYDLKNICKENISQKGIKNSQYGTCWINNGIENKKIKKETFINYPNWILGKVKNSQFEIDRLALIEERKTLILNSEIDFSKFGWVGEVSNLIDTPSQNVNKFMKKHLFEFYDKCFKRNIK